MVLEGGIRVVRAKAILPVRKTTSCCCMTLLPGKIIANFLPFNCFVVVVVGCGGGGGLFLVLFFTNKPYP